MIWIDRVLVSRGEGGVYGERMIKNLRVWDPYRSKLSAFYYKGQGIDLVPDMKVLYLGAAHGTTISHVADYVDVVYAVEVAPRPMRDLLEVARRRENIVPIMADAAHPERYAPLVEEVDLIYQDVAQPDQDIIAHRNSVFLKKEGILILMLKTRSVDVRKEPSVVLAETETSLAERSFTVMKHGWLEPYHLDHAAIICRNEDRIREQV